MKLHWLLWGEKLSKKKLMDKEKKRKRRRLRNKNQKMKNNRKNPQPQKLLQSLKLSSRLSQSNRNFLPKLE